MHYLYSDCLDYNEVEKIKRYFEIKDVKYIGYNNEGIVVDFFYNNRMYGYQRLIETSTIEFSSMQEEYKSVNIEIHDLETLIDITDDPHCFVGENSPVSKETLKDWKYIGLIFDLIRIHADDADGCKYLESLSYQDFKNDPKVKAIIGRDILDACELYIETINDNHTVLKFQKDSVRDGIYKAYHLIIMNHLLMEKIKKYPEYKQRFCKVVEVARQLGLYEEQLIISEFVASIQDSPDKWQL